MASKDDVKKALGNLFFKDLDRFDPGNEGLVIGETTRVYTGGDEVELRFLLGSPPNQRQGIMDRLKVAKIPFVEGKDFRG
jgi:hypothetical protein